MKNLLIAAQVSPECHKNNSCQLVEENADVMWHGYLPAYSQLHGNRACSRHNGWVCTFLNPQCRLLSLTMYELSTYTGCACVPFSV